MKILSVLALFVLTGCTYSENKKPASTVPIDTGPGQAAGIKEASNRPAFRSLTAKNEMTGIWRTDDKEWLTVKISDDSIYYPEHFESYKYELEKDSIFIRYPDFVLSGRIGLIGDTLVIFSDNGRFNFLSVKD